MKITVQFPMTDAPDYLATLGISRDGDFVEINIADENNRLKAYCKISAKDFTHALRALELVT